MVEEGEGVQSIFAASRIPVELALNACCSRTKKIIVPQASPGFRRVPGRRKKEKRTGRDRHKKNVSLAVICVLQLEDRPGQQFWDNGIEQNRLRHDLFLGLTALLPAWLVPWCLYS